MANLNSINSLNITELIIISTLDSLSEFQLDSNTQRAHRHGVKLPHDSHDGTSLQGGQSSSLPRKFHFQICNRVSSSLRHPSYLLQFHSTVLKPTTKRYKKLQVESRQNSRRPKILPSKISLLQDTYIYIHTYTPVGANRCPETRTAPLDFLSRMVERRHPMMGARRKRCVP